MNSKHSVAESLKQINKNLTKDPEDTCQKQNKTKPRTGTPKWDTQRYLIQISTSRPSGEDKTNYHEMAPHPLEWLLSKI